MPLSAGDKLGPYEILAPIAAGGMGEVWKARDSRLDRIVAIKQLKSHYTERFELEARAIAALNHPNICTLHDVGPDYLVMEYVEGEPLRGPLRVEEAVKLALQIAGALEEAPGRGILHRDLKPGNILVTRKGAAKLLDFGLAKLMSHSDSDVTKTTEGAIVGTAAYMAPEQVEGKLLDERSDVFSFGAVLYEMLSGKGAFGRNSSALALSAVLRDDPSPLQAPAELQRASSPGAWQSTRRIAFRIWRSSGLRSSGSPPNLRNSRCHRFTRPSGCPCCDLWGESFVEMVQLRWSEAR